jgi:hypothetical protein
MDLGGDDSKASCLKRKASTLRHFSPLWLPRDLSPKRLHHRSQWRRTSQILAELHVHKTSHVSLNTPSISSSKPINLKLLTLFAFIAVSYISMSFLSRLFNRTMSTAPAPPMDLPAGAQKVTVAAGCFWGVEHMYRRAFANKGLYDARVGYIGGDTQNPSYRAVCSGRTGRKLSLSQNQNVG